MLEANNKMASHAFLLALLIILFHLQKAEAKPTAKPSPDCQRKCGQIEIPYPFGMTKDCYLDETFEVKCDESTGHASLAWLKGHQLIDFISASTYTLRIRNSPIVPFSKINKSRLQAFSIDRSGEIFSNGWYSAANDQYFLSFTQNKFVVRGCDFYAYLIDNDTKEVLGGCTAPFCNQSDILPSPSSSCSRLHCCEINIPDGVRSLSVQLETMNTLTKPLEYQYCGFFAFVDKNFLFNHSIELPQCNKNYSFPITYEWAVGNTSCDKAKASGNYACKQNTGCVDKEGRRGYTCECRKGYQGNPYLPGGCQDFDECAKSDYNDCPKENPCVNTKGGYYCSGNQGRKSAWLIPLGTGLAVGVLILVAMGVWGWRKIKKIKERKMRQSFFKRNGGLLLQQQIPSSGARLLLELTLFNIEDLEKATDKFSENRILGKGGLGTVYKGMLSDGRIVAVKKANIIDDSQIDQFINEVFILSQINHRNIVKLFGCCLEAEVPLLVYEYISNGTLSSHLHDEPNIYRISWENRLRIVAEVAGALAYLHSCATTAIFHRDIKSSNILLDENYKALICDFGLSRSVSVDKTHLTTLVGGTFGYFDPEYFRSGQLNEKSDVYAFGVVLAEILTGQKAISSTRDDMGLAIRFRLAVKEQHLFEILDEVVACEGKQEEIVIVAKLAKRCLKISAHKRPSMREVAAELDQLRKIKEIPGHQESFVWSGRM